MSQTAQKVSFFSPKTLFSAAVSLLCLWWIFSSVDQEKFVAQLSVADPVFLVIAVLLTMASYLARSWRWQFFFASSAPAFRDSFRCLIMGFFMNNILPARMGELVRAHLGGKASGISRTLVLATIAGERLADGLTISILLAVGVSMFSRTEAPELLYVAYLFFAVSCATLGVLVFREKIFALLEKMSTIMPGHISSFTLEKIKFFIQGLEPLMSLSSVLKLTVLSLFAWGLEILVYYFVTLAFHVEMGIDHLILFLSAVNFSSLIPAAPGGIGVIEFFATQALVKIGYEGELSLSMVLTQHVIQYLVVGVPGAYYFFSTMHGKFPGVSSDAEEPKEGPTAKSDFEDSAGATRTDDLLRDLGEEELVEVSVVIPAYNEEDRLPKTLVSVLEFLSGNYEKFEIIVVSDGSTDDTVKVVSQFSSLAAQIRVISYENNRGKGHAVRLGVLSARGRRVLFNDADGSTPIEELQRLEDALSDDIQVAIGSRAMFSDATSVDTVWYRKYIGRTFNAIVNLIVLPGIADTQCGFKLFTRSAAQYLFTHQTSDGFSFDVELLFLARKAKYGIAEVPVNWTNVPGSKVDLVQDSTRMFFDILRFRIADFAGTYRKGNSYVATESER